MKLVSLLSDIARGFNVDRWWKLYQHSQNSGGYLNSIGLSDI